MIHIVRFARKAFRQLRHFRRDERGSMAMMMGLAAVPIIFSVGAGIDYGTANAAKSKLDAVADTAALSAVDQCRHRRHGRRRANDGAKYLHR
jgi:Flp pilus assembly protein TadG